MAKTCLCCDTPLHPDEDQICMGCRFAIHTRAWWWRGRWRRVDTVPIKGGVL